MIIALVRYIRAEADRSLAFATPDVDADGAARLRSV